jgi:hypothetical protein
MVNGCHFFNFYLFLFASYILLCYDEAEIMICVTFRCSMRYWFWHLTCFQIFNCVINKAQLRLVRLFWVGLGWVGLGLKICVTSLSLLESLLPLSTIGTLLRKVDSTFPIGCCCSDEYKHFSNNYPYMQLSLNENNFLTIGLVPHTNVFVAVGPKHKLIWPNQLLFSNLVVV